MIFEISETGGFIKQLKVSNESNGEFYSNSTVIQLQYLLKTATYDAAEMATCVKQRAVYDTL